MPSSTASIASRWLGLGGIETTSATASPPATMREAPRWYLTSPLHWTPSMARELRTGSLNSARICSYGLPSTCAITFNRPRCAMPMNASRIPASAASVMTSSRIGTSMSRPSIEKRVLPGNERWMNFSNASTCVKRSSSASGSIGLCGARNRLVSMASRSQWRSSGTKMCAKSYPVVEQYNVRNRSTTSAIVLAPCATGELMSVAGSAARSSSVTPCVAGSSAGSPLGRLPSGSICAAR